MLVGELWPGVGSVPGFDGCGATPLLSLTTLSNTTVPNSLIQAYSMLVGEPAVMAVALLLSLTTLSNTIVPNSLIQAYSMLVGELWPGVGSVSNCDGCGATPLPYHSFKHNSA